MEPEHNVIHLPINEAAVAQAPAPVSEAPGVPESAGGNVDKIRDLLFGAQMRDYDKRFARLEERLLKESGELREETRQRFDALESFLKNELAALSDRIKSEARQRDERDDELSRQLQDTAKNIERKFGQFDDQTAQAQRELRQQLLEQSKALSEEIRRKHDELAAKLAREADELRNEKTDRAALADLFTELALRLNNQFRLPGE